MGEEARDKLELILTEYEDLFMKNKSDIGKCKIAKHRIELESEAIPHREGARRMSPDKAAKESQSGNAKLASSGSDSTLLLSMGQCYSHGKKEIRRASLLL